MTLFAVSSKTTAWLKGLFAGAISAFATAVSGVFTLPTVFNFTHNGIINVVKVGAVPALYAIFTYLRQSPLPGILGPGDTATVKDPVVSPDGTVTGSSATLVKAPPVGDTLPPKP